MNNNFKNFCIQKFNKEDNYNAILKKVEEEGIMKEKKNLKILKIAAVFIFVITLGLATPQLYGKIKWNIEYKEYEQRETIYGSASIKEAIESGYGENVQMDYIHQDQIGIKLNSLMITDDYFEMETDLKLPEDIEINTDTLSYGLAIYDENNNIYAVVERIHTADKKIYNYNKKLYKELEINSDTVPLVSSCVTGISSAEKGNIIMKTTMTSTKGFPKSKKLYIRIFDIGYNMIEVDKQIGKIISSEDFQISNAEWKIEIDVPKKFYERKEVNLEIQENINGLEIEKFEATETRLTLIAKIEGLKEFVFEGKDMDSSEFTKQLNEKIYITDENGNKYYQTNLGTTGNDNFKMFFEVNKNKLNKKLFLNVNINEQLFTTPIIIK